MGSKSQRKGRAGELELARLLQGYGYDVQPGQAVSYGATPDLVGLPHIHIECKRNERLNVPEAMAHRRNRSGWLVTQRLEDWIAIYRKKEPPASHTDSDTSG